jgi:hypothetical protein
MYEKDRNAKVKILEVTGYALELERKLNQELDRLYIDDHKVYHVKSEIINSEEDDRSMMRYTVLFVIIYK